MPRNADGIMRVPSPTDGVILDFFAEVAGQAPINANVLGASLPGMVGVSALDAELGSDWRQSRTISLVTSQLNPRLTLSFSRSVSEPNIHGGQLPVASEHEAEIWLDWAAFNREQDQPIVWSVAASVDALRRKISVAPGVTTSPELMKSYRQQFKSLTDLHTKLIADAAEERAKGEAALSQRREQLEAEAAQIREEDQHRVRSAESRLDELRSALDNRQKDLDDRAYTHARRQMRAEITEALKVRLAEPMVSLPLRRQRVQILNVCIALLGIFGTIAFVTSMELFLQSTRTTLGVEQLLILTGRVAVAVAAFAGVAFYLLSWLRQVHDGDLRSERDLERYRYDLDRASWAIETILEADAKVGERDASPVPDRWVEGVTNGLFARTEAREEPGLEALGSLLNFAAEAEFGPTGAKLRLNKRGLRGLKKAEEAERRPGGD